MAGVTCNVQGWLFCKGRTVAILFYDTVQYLLIYTFPAVALLV